MTGACGSDSSVSNSITGALTESGLAACLREPFRHVAESGESSVNSNSWRARRAAGLLETDVGDGRHDVVVDD